MDLFLFGEFLSLFLLLVVVFLPGSIQSSSSSSSSPSWPALEVSLLFVAILL